MKTKKNIEDIAIDELKNRSLKIITHGCSERLEMQTLQLLTVSTP